MVSNRELDKEIATNIFKHVVMYEDGKEKVIRQRDGAKMNLPPYSSDTDTAYKVVRWFKRRGFEVKMGYSIEGDHVEWYTQIQIGGAIFEAVHAKTLAEAICLAAIAWTKKDSVKKPSKNEDNLISIDFPKKED